MNVEVGDYVLVDSIMYDRQTGGIRQVVKVSGQRVYLDEPAFACRSDYVMKKTLRGCFHSYNDAIDVVNADKDFEEQIRALRKAQRDTVEKMVKDKGK